MTNEVAEKIVIKYITSHEGATVTEIFEGINKKETVLSINSLRRLIRRLYRERKIARSGIHTFKYKIRK